MGVLDLPDGRIGGGQRVDEGQFQGQIHSCLVVFDPRRPLTAIKLSSEMRVEEGVEWRSVQKGCLGPRNQRVSPIQSPPSPAFLPPC